MLPTKEQIQTAYKQAPEYVQDFIVSEELNKAFTDIRTEHKLHLDDAGRLSLAINAVVLELAPLTSFPQLVGEALTDVSSETRSAVVSAVNEKVFEELREWARLDKEGLLYEKVDESENESAETVNQLKGVISSVEELQNEVSRGQKKETSPQTQKDGAEVELSEKSTAPQQNVPKKPYPGSDPYREPIE